MSPQAESHILTAIGWFGRDQNHRFPEIWDPTDSAEFFHLKTGLPQENAECLLRPELDMPVVPQGSEVGIHSSHHRHSDIFEVAMIRSGNDRLA